MILKGSSFLTQLLVSVNKYLRIKLKSSIITVREKHIVSNIEFR